MAEQRTSGLITLMRNFSARLTKASEKPMVEEAPKPELTEPDATSTVAVPDASVKRASAARTLVLLFVFYGGIGYLVLSRIEYGRNHPTLVHLLGASVAAVLAIAPFVLWFKGASDQKKLAVGLGSSVTMVLAALLLGPALQATVFSIIFAIVLTLMPATLYSLFRSARGFSLADEFVSNLKRLGVSDTADSRRLLSYVHEFDALYGPLDDRQRALIARELKLDPDDLPGPQRGLLQRIGNPTAEARFPVALTTLMCALGWFLTLTPVAPNAGAELASLFAGTAQFLSAPDFLTSPEGASAGQIGPPSPIAPRNAIPPTHVALSQVLRPEESPMAFAFYGAYFFSLQLLFLRFMRRDLSSRAYVGVCLRFVLSAISTWVVVLVVAPAGFEGIKLDLTENSPWLLGMAFLIGVFPKTVLTMVANLFRHVPGISNLLPSLHSRRQLSELDGLTLWHEARLEEEDVDNIPNMATIDLAELVICTRVTANRLVDWVDQAILLRHLPWDREENDWTDLRRTLESRGVRMASSLKNLWIELNADTNPNAFAWVDPENGNATVAALICAAEDCPNLRLIECWRKG